MALSKLKATTKSLLSKRLYNVLVSCSDKFKMEIKLTNELKKSKHNIIGKPFKYYNKSTIRRIINPIIIDKISVRNVSTYEHLIAHPVSGSTASSTDQGKSPCNEKQQQQMGRHQFHQDVESQLNGQVNDEFVAAYTYLSMSCYFGRTEITLPGSQGFFMNMYEEELDHALVLANYVLMRGGHVVLQPIPVPDNQNWESILNALEVAVTMERTIKEKLCKLYEIAEKHNDIQLMDFISSPFLEEQNRSICELARLHNQAKISNDCIGRYLFDKLLYNSFVKKSKNSMYKSTVEVKESEQVYK